MSKPLIYLSVLLFFVVALLWTTDEPEPISPDSPALTFEEFDEFIQAPVSKISSVKLAEFLKQQSEHYNLIDLSNGQQGYQIPTSDAHSVESFMALDIPVNETIILYTVDETEAIQLYYTLVMRGYFKVKVLAGGLRAWQDEILQPSPDLIPTEEHKQRRELTEFFGGQFNQQASGFKAKPVSLTKAKKKHQGC